MSARRPLRVLTYHRVLDVAPGSTGPSLISATPRTFREQVRHLAGRYRVVSAADVLHALRAGSALPARSVLLTFDDGTRDFGEVAWPILRRYRMPATVFVSTAYPGEPARTFWWDRLHTAFLLARRPYLDLPPLGRLPLDGSAARRTSLGRVRSHLKTVPAAEVEPTVERVCRELGSTVTARPDVLGWDELRDLARDGVTIAAHTRTHAALTRLPRDDARAEIRGSREDLRREIGDSPPIFAYPFGDHDGAVADLAREEGFEIAVTTLPGQNDLARADPLRLRRTNVGRRTGPWLFRLRLVPALSGMEARWRGAGEPAARPARDGRVS